METVTQGIRPGTLKVTKSDTPKSMFAWEFLRRNPDYQTDYSRLVSMADQQGAREYYESGLGLSITRHLAFTKSTPYLAFHAELYRTLTKWGLLAWLPDPANDLQTSPPLSALWRMGNDGYLSTETFHDNSEPIPLDGGIIPTDTETFLLFDISRPLAKQIEDMKNYLEQQQFARYGKVLGASRSKEQGKRSNPRKEKLYVTYLRVLDADVCGVDDAKIINQFVDEALMTHRPGIVRTALSHTNPSQNSLRNWRIAAKALRDEGFRNLL